jgi:predicted CopG family antitoxin
MTDELENASGRSRHLLMITDDAWAALLQHADIEGYSASNLCEYLMAKYAEMEAPPVFAMPTDLERESRKKGRTVYINDAVWNDFLGVKVYQGRSISEIVEQLVRAYTGLPLGDRLE